MKKPDRLAKELVDAALELHRRRLWLEVRGDAPFLVRVPGEEHPLLVSIMGQNRSEYGVVLFRGPGTAARAARRATGQPAPDAMDEESILSATMEPLGEIPSEMRGPLRAAGFQARREALAPILLAKPAGRRPRAPNRSEMRILLQALRAVLQVHDEGRLAPPSVGGASRRILEIEVSEDPRAGATSRIVRYEEAEERAPSREPVSLPADLAGLPRIEGRWVIALQTIPEAIQGESRLPRAVLVCDETSGDLIEMEVVLAGDDAGVAEKLAGFFRARGLPRGIAFANEALHGALAEALLGLDVGAAFEPEHPVVADLREAMLKYVASLGPPAGGDETPRTLEEWKAADASFTAHLVAAMEEEELVTPRALSRYFGSKLVAAEVEESLEDWQPSAAFAEWLVADYRLNARSETFLEKAQRSGDWTRTERLLLKARSEAELSIYAVVATEPGSSLEVEDLLSGRRTTVHDRAMSGCDLEGIFLPLRLFPAGEWTFCAVAGPPLGVMHITRAMDRLEALGMELTPQGMRKSAHLLGRLWELALRAQEAPIQLQNTDGEPLALHAATFHVDDPDQVASLLGDRDDLDYDDEEGIWSWIREGAPVAGIGEITRLGTLQLIGAELLLEVNSAGRFERARRWIEALPGVRFERVTVQDPDFDLLPADDRLPGPRPGPPDSELMEQMRQMQLAAGLRWLDEPVPALGNLTPRAACATVEGRRRVAVMVRSMPPLGYPGGRIPAPTGQLLAELGIGAEE